MTFVFTGAEVAEIEAMKVSERLPANYFRNNIEYFMGRRKISTYDLQVTLGTTWLIARAIETGKKKPTEVQVERMAKLFKCHPEDITKPYNRKHPFIKKFRKKV